MERARNRAEVDFAHQLENYDARADLIAMLSTYFGDPTLVTRWIDPYRNTSAADLQRVTQKYLVPDNRVTIQFLPQ
jgi:predicted Zn-dependent peptidase